MSPTEEEPFMQRSMILSRDGSPRRRNVSDVWVDGEQVIENRRSTKLDFAELRKDVNQKVSQLNG